MFWEKINEWLITLLLRGVLGILFVHFLNVGLLKYGYPTMIGLNLYTIPIISALGMPGIGPLYVLKMFW